MLRRWDRCRCRRSNPLIRFAAVVAGGPLSLHPTIIVHLAGAMLLVVVQLVMVVLHRSRPHRISPRRVLVRVRLVHLLALVHVLLHLVVWVLSVRLLL